MFVLLSLARSEVVPITSENFSVVGLDRPYMIKFYRETCPHCQQMAADFVEASEMYTEVGFGAISCETDNKLCDDYKISGVPTVILFGAHNKTGAIFEGHERNADGFADFIEETIHIKAVRPPKYVRDLTPLNYNHTLDNAQCAFVTFFAPYCGHCKRWLPKNKIVAKAFAADNNTVTVGTVNCEKFHSLCENVQGYPTIRLFKKGVAEPVEYSGDRSPEDVAKFINTNCGTQRAVDGLLTDEAGILKEAEEIVKEFLHSEDKAAAIAKAKELKANLYVTFMERIVKNGVEKSKEDLAKIRAMLDARTSSYKVLDNLKTRYNVFSTLLGEREPKEVPAAEQPAAEQPAAEKPAAEQPAAEKPAENKEL